MFWMCARPSETVLGDERLFLTQLLKGGMNLTGCPSPSHCGGAARLNFRRRQERWGLLNLLCKTVKPLFLDVMLLLLLSRFSRVRFCATP